MNSFMNVVLVEPEIPQNTGNIGRTCLGVGATLHLVGQLGFSLSEKNLKRAGLDYWPKLDVRRYDTWDSFLEKLDPGVPLHFFSTHGTISLWEQRFSEPAYLIFGSESKGFPKKFYTAYRDRLVRIPVRSDIRSLNLATAVGVSVFEAMRQINGKKISHSL